MAWVDWIGEGALAPVPIHPFSLSLPCCREGLHLVNMEWGGFGSATAFPMLPLHDADNIMGGCHTGRRAASRAIVVRAYHACPVPTGSPSVCSPSRSIGRARSRAAVPTTSRSRVGFRRR